MIGVMRNLKEILMGNDPVSVLWDLFNNNTLAQLSPELAKLRMEVPKGYHHKDNLAHSFKVLQNAIDRETNGPDIVLRTAALFHDVGKPATRKLGTKKSVSFDGHEAVGAKMMKYILLGQHGYKKKDIQQISQLVRFHMRSHGFDNADWTDSAVRRLINDVGNDKQLERLIIIFYADVTTKNSQKRSRVHSSIDSLKKAIDKVVQEDARKALRPAINGNEVMSMFNLQPGRELGKIMKFLNTDEGIVLSREDAIQTIREKFLEN